MSENIKYYSTHAEKLADQYNSVAFEKVHADWLSEIPEKGFVLDVGAGSGRDARFLAVKGLSVVAVEPAEGHPDAVLERTKEHVVLPVGLVALYWVKQIKPLIDHFQIPQSSNRQKGLGFVKEGGWQELRYITSPGSEVGVFHVESKRTTKPSGRIVIDASFLASFGRFYIPVNVWDSMPRFSVWIEPSLVD